MYGFWLFQANGDRNVDTKEGKVTASLGVLTQYNMLLNEAIYELLADKGIVSKEEVLERVRKLKEETTVHFRHSEACPAFGATHSRAKARPWLRTGDSLDIRQKPRGCVLQSRVKWS